MDAPAATPPDRSPGPGSNPDPAAAELAGAMGWYDRSAGRSKIWYQGLRVLTMVLAATIPVVAAFDATPAVSAVLGGLIVVIEGFQQLFQFHERWVGYRKTWNALDQERRLYESQAGPYDGAGEPGKRLTERMTMILSSENSDWAALAASAASQDT